MKMRFLCIITSLLFHVACDKEVKTEEIAGTWVITNNSWANVPSNIKKDSALLVLYGDRTFTAKNLPGLFFVPPGSIESNSGRGNWKFIGVEGGRKVQLEFLSVTANQNMVLPYGTQLNISNGITGFKLFYYLGDPDSGKRLSLKKIAHAERN